MKKIFRIVFSLTDNESKIIKGKKIPFKNRGSLGIIEIDENDKLWEEMKSIIKRFDLPHTCKIYYSKQEIKNASYFILKSSWHWNYPQPDEIDGKPVEDLNGHREYEKATYDVSNLCGICGVGKKQNRPFLLKKEPEWGNKQFLQLNWVFDAFFIKAELWDIIKKEKLAGIAPIIPLHSKTRVPLKSVVQLGIQTVLPPGFANSIKPLICKKNKSIPPLKIILKSCGRPKFLPIVYEQSMFKKDIFHNAPDFVLSNEWFGDGRGAYRKVIVSRHAADIMIKNKWKGIVWEPIKLI